MSKIQTLSNIVSEGLCKAFGETKIRTSLIEGLTDIINLYEYNYTYENGKFIREDLQVHNEPVEFTAKEFVENWIDTLDDRIYSCEYQDMTDTLREYIELQNSLKSLVTENQVSNNLLKKLLENWLEESLTYESLEIDDFIDGLKDFGFICYKEIEYRDDCATRFCYFEDIKNRMVIRVDIYNDIDILVTYIEGYKKTEKSFSR